MLSPFGNNKPLRHKSFNSVNNLREFLVNRTPANVFYSTAYWEDPNQLKMSEKEGEALPKNTEGDLGSISEGIIYNQLSIINRFIFLLNSLCLILLLFAYISPFINPTFFWPISLLGLLFPILIIINLIFLIYWGILRKRSFFANLIILLIGFPFTEKYVGSNGITFGIDEFGKSAPYKDIYKFFGLESSNIANKTKKLVKN